MNTAENAHSQWPGLGFTKADRLQKALDYAHISQQDMADALGVSRQTIGNYTSGRTRIPKLALREWALRTGAPIEWIETGDFPENTKKPPMSGGRKMNSQPWDYKAEHSAEILFFPTREKDTLLEESTIELCGSGS